MYGTSMVVSAGHGLGESTDSSIWGDVVSSAITGVSSYFSAQQKEEALAREREFQLKLAKLTQNASINQAQSSTGETTQDGMYGMNSKLLIGLGVGAVALVGVVMLFGRKRRR